MNVWPSSIRWTTAASRIPARCFGLSSLFLCLVLGGCAMLQGSDTPGTEGMLVPSPYLGQQLVWNWWPPKNDVNWEHEYVQPGESLSNWTELVTVGCYRKVLRLGTVEAHLDTLRSELVAHCPGSTLEVIPGQAGIVLFETHVVNCKTYADESRITRVLDGDEDRFVVRFAFRGTKTLTPERREEWIKKLSAVILTHRPQAY